MSPTIITLHDNENRRIETDAAKIVYIINLSMCNPGYISGHHEELWISFQNIYADYQNDLAEVVRVYNEKVTAALSRVIPSKRILVDCSVKALDKDDPWNNFNVYVEVDGLVPFKQDFKFDNQGRVLFEDNPLLV